MKNKEINKNLILKIRTGSHLYGTNTKDSDEDFVGIFMPTEEYVYGLKKIEEIDESIISKDENNKNTKEAVDCKYYEFRKFIKLAYECNPNILEILFVNLDNIVYINGYGKQLLCNRQLFVSGLVKQKFLGYAFAQKHKMQIKAENYFDLKQAINILIEYTNVNALNFNMYLIEAFPLLEGYNIFKKNVDKNNNFKFFTIGDLNLQPSYSVRQAISIIKDRLSKVGNREELLTKYGYDTKFGMHLIRLMFEGKELLTTGNLQFPLKDKNLLLDIRNGKWKSEDVIAYSEELENEIESIYNNTKISKQKFDEVNKLCMNMLKQYLMEN